MIKLIRLQALGGLLQGPLMEVPVNIREWRIPYQKDTKQPFNQEDLTNKPYKDFITVVFVTTGKFEILPNKRTAEIFEVEFS